MTELLGCQLAITIVRIPTALHSVENSGSFTSGGRTQDPTTQNSACKDNFLNLLFFKEMQDPFLFLRSSEKLQSWASQMLWVADLIFPSKDGKARKHVLNGLRIGPDPLAAKAGEKTALCPSQSPLFQEEGIPKRPRTPAHSTSIAPRTGCSNGSPALQALSKGAGYRN